MILSCKWQISRRSHLPCSEGVRWSPLLWVSNVFQCSLGPEDACGGRKLHNALTVVLKTRVLDMISRSKGMTMSIMRMSWHSDSLILFWHWNSAAENAYQSISYTYWIWGKKCPQLLFSCRFPICKWVILRFFAPRT